MIEISKSCFLGVYGFPYLVVGSSTLYATEEAAKIAQPAWQHYVLRDGAAWAYLYCAMPNFLVLKTSRSSHIIGYH
jgi:uncharacterized membrane protein